MRSVYRNFRLFPWLRFLAPDGVVSGGGVEGTPVDESMLDALPGGELLRGATEVKPGEEEVEEWAEGDGGNDEGRMTNDEGADEAEGRGSEDEDDDDDEEEEGQQAAAGDLKEGEQPAAAEIPADWPEEAKGRVAQLAAERETLAKANTDLSAKVADLEGKVAAGPGPVLVPTRSNPLSRVTDARGLQANEEFARSLKTFAFRASKDGGELPKDLQAALDGVPVEKITEARTITAEEAQDLYENAEAMLEKHIPARRRYLEEESAAQSALQDLAPEMLKTDSEDGKLYSAFLQQFPEAKLLSRWPTVMAAVVIGHKVLEERAKSKGKATEGADGSKNKSMSKSKNGEALAPVAPAPPKGGGASNGIVKRKPHVQLSASMDAEELAALM